MLEILLVVLIILWLSGNLVIPGIVIPNPVLFIMNGQRVDLISVLTFILILWVLGLLPSPLREIAGILLFFWVLSLFGLLAIPGLSSLIVIAVIIGIIVTLVNRRHLP